MWTRSPTDRLPIRPTSVCARAEPRGPANERRVALGGGGLFAAVRFRVRPPVSEPFLVLPHRHGRLSHIAVRFRSAGPGARRWWKRVTGPSARSGHGLRRAPGIRLRSVVAPAPRSSPPAVMAGLVPAIHVSRHRGASREGTRQRPDVDARNKSIVVRLDGLDRVRGVGRSGLPARGPGRDTDCGTPAAPAFARLPPRLPRRHPRRHGRTCSGHPRLAASRREPGGNEATARRGYPEQVRA